MADMNEKGVIYSKESILSTLVRTQDDVSAFFMSHSPQDFFEQKGTEWSLSQNLEHLIRSITPVTMALRLPRFLLRLLFGTPGKPSAQFEDIKQDYVGELTRGARASGPYLPPKPSMKIEQSTAQIRLVNKWRRAAGALVDSIKNWQEQDLDRYLLPHPILGRLTVRELLFFTIYHDMRHMSPDGD
jgi:hypothetical protein